MPNPVKEVFNPLKFGGKYTQFKLSGEIEKREDVETATGIAQKLALLKALRKLLEILDR